MSLETTIVTNFTGGELSPLLRSRVDVEKYYNGCETVVNLVVLPQGGATKRPGTRYVAAAKSQDATKPERPLPFVFSVTQAYALGFGGGDGVPLAISGTANNGDGASHVRLTVASNSTLLTGMFAKVTGIIGTREANGIWQVTRVDATHVDLTFASVAAPTYANAYGSGGTITPWQGYMRVYKNDAVVTAGYTVQSAANNGAGLIRITLDGGTFGGNLFTGNTVTISGVTGTTEANGTWSIIMIDATNFDLVGSAFVHAYSAGGAVSAIVEIPTPYRAVDLAALGYVQSTDTLFVTHPLNPPAAITRSSHTRWTYGTQQRFTISALTVGPQMILQDGPYLAVNVSSATMQASALSGNGVVVTLSNGTAINGGAGFQPGDVGRLLRIKASAKWGWSIIEEVTTTTTIKVALGASVIGGADNVFDGTGATTSWQLGAWSDTTGWPYVPTFFQQRLMFLGNDGLPSGIWSTITSGFVTNVSLKTLTFSPTGNDGTVTATNGLSFIIADDQVNAGRWLSAAGSAQSMQLGIGTSTSEQILQPASASSALSPTNLQVYRETQYGSQFNTAATTATQPIVRAQRIGKAVLFANRNGRRLHEWAFDWRVNGYIGPDLVEFSEHITEPGIVQLEYQQNPFSIVWALLSDGTLIGFTYRPDQKVFAPHRHRLGGNYNGGVPFIEGMCVIPSPDGTYDELWLVVLRTVNGATVRSYEVLTGYFRAGKNRLAYEQAFFVDCGLTSPLTYPAFTCTPSGLADVNAGYADKAPAFTGVGTFTATGAAFAGTSTDVNKVIRINGGKAVVIAAISTSACTASVIVPLSSQAAASANTWSCTTPATTFSGAAHLEGETVSIRGDGAKYAQAAVSGGAVTLSPSATLVSLGLPYAPALKTMRYETAGSGPRTAAGRIKRIIDLYLRLFETSSCKFGAASDVTLDQVLSRSTDDPMGQPSPLITDDEKVPMPGGSNKEGQIYATQDPADAGPLTLLGVVADVDVGQKKVAA